MVHAFCSAYWGFLKLASDICELTHNLLHCMQTKKQACKWRGARSACVHVCVYATTISLRKWLGMVGLSACSVALHSGQRLLPCSDRLMHFPLQWICMHMSSNHTIPLSRLPLPTSPFPSSTPMHAPEAVPATGAAGLTKNVQADGAVAQTGREYRI